MDNHAVFRFDHARHVAASELKPQHIPDFQRLAKDLRFGSRFQLLICEYSDAIYRDALIQRINEVLAAEDLRSERLALSQEIHSDFAMVEADLCQLAADHQAIHLVGGESWFDDARWQAFNIRREAVARDVPVRLLLWLRAEPIARLARLAPDLWAWRAGVFSFATADAPIPSAPVAQTGPIDTRSLAERSKRIATLREYLLSDPPPPDDIRLPLLDEMAGLYVGLGDLDAALLIREQEQLPVCEKLGDARSVAATRGKIADILEMRGDLDEALRIRKEETLPVYEKLGDARSVAVTRGKIADILQVRGDLDAALRIREEEELPVYERLGDAREAAITRSKIAGILEACGELETALRLHEQEVLPVLDRIGDIRNATFVRERIAALRQLIAAAPSS